MLVHLRFKVTHIFPSMLLVDSVDSDVFGNRWCVPLHQKVEGLLHITSCTQQKQLEHPGGFKHVRIFVSVSNVTGLVNCTLYELELQKCWFYGLNSKSW